MNNTTEDLLSTRWSLIHALKDKEDNASWDLFYQTYWKLIYCAALQAGCLESEAQEVVQETLICVARQIHEFRADPSAGSFKGWLLTITRRRIVDQLRLRKRGRYVSVSDDAALDERADCDTDEPVSWQFEEAWQNEWEAHLLNAAMDRLRTKVSPRQFQIFHLMATQQLSVAEVGRALELNSTQVYLARHRVGKLFEREVRHLERCLC